MSTGMPKVTREALDEMDVRNAAISSGDARELIWLLEHPPVYTAGTSAASEELLDPRFEVVEAGLRIVERCLIPYPGLTIEETEQKQLAMNIGVVLTHS